jgi:hypothetical protein
VAAGLQNNNNNNSPPPSIYSPSSSTSTSLYIPVFFLTPSPHQHFFPTSSTYNPSPTFGTCVAGGLRWVCGASPVVLMLIDSYRIFFYLKKREG